MPTTVAADLEEALEVTAPNFVGMGTTDVQPRLIQWRNEFFSALDVTEPNQEPIYRWIGPTNVLIQNTASASHPWELDLWRRVPIMQVVARTIVAARFNGYTPPAALDTALTQAFNNAWT